jgi:hypothetical protein
MLAAGSLFSFIRTELFIFQLHPQLIVELCHLPFFINGLELTLLCFNKMAIECIVVNLKERIKLVFSVAGFKPCEYLL